MGSVKLSLRSGVCTVFLISLVYSLSAAQEVKEQTTAIKLWSKGIPAFGIWVPDEREQGARRGPDGIPLPPIYTKEGGERLAKNELLDFVFLDLEETYSLDPAGALDAVEAIASGFESGYDERVGEISLFVRIPPVWWDGEEAARERVAECLGVQGVDGIVIPHVRSAEMARTAVSFFTEIGADVWSPQNPDGTIISWFMIEDPWALSVVDQIANVPGISVLVCGIGSLHDSLGDNWQAAEVGNQLILEHTKRVGIPNVTLGNANTAKLRLLNGFDGLLFFGPNTNEGLEIAHKAARTLHMR